MEFFTNLDKKVKENSEMKLHDTICMWSDLLGFGKPLFDSQFNLTEETTKNVFNRLQEAHKIFLSWTNPYGEKSLIINDGIVKTSTLTQKDHLDEFGYLIRSCIETHLRICENEEEKNLPGTRTILAAGQSIEYIAPEINFDDYVMNYTKPNPNELSNLAKENGNPIIVYNPKPFQMNMAFSKAYSLDNLGSKYGLAGANFFIDNSVINFMERLARYRNVSFIRNENDGVIQVYLKKCDDRCYFGFELTDENKVSYNGWNTTTYRVISFYPPDENMSEFKYEIPYRKVNNWKRKQ